MTAPVHRASEEKGVAPKLANPTPTSRRSSDCADHDNCFPLEGTATDE